MDKNSTYEQLLQPLRATLPIAELYDFDRIKDRIRTVFLQRPTGGHPANTLPQIPMEISDLTGIFLVELYSDREFTVGYHITHQHLALWNMTEQELLKTLIQSSDT
ncbi:MAG: hypothetical protein IJZ55_09115 [Lachnospiraceae bacterium]|nr:hypothetical protein [Lachnospiraceae bacterium]